MKKNYRMLSYRQRENINTFRKALKFEVGTDFTTDRIQILWNMLLNSEKAALLKLWDIYILGTRYEENQELYYHRICQLFDDKDYVYFFLYTKEVEQASMKEYLKRMEQDAIATFFFNWMKLNEFRSEFQCEYYGVHYTGLSDKKVRVYWEKLSHIDRNKILERWNVSSYEEAILLHSCN